MLAQARPSPPPTQTKFASPKKMLSRPAGSVAPPTGSSGLPLGQRPFDPRAYGFIRPAQAGTATRANFAPAPTVPAEAPASAGLLGDFLRSRRRENVEIDNENLAILRQGVFRYI